MKPGKYDIVDDFWRGNTFERLFTLKDGDDAPINLTGSEVRFTLTAKNVTIELSTDDAPVMHTDATTILSGLVVVGSAADGTVRLVLSPTQTRSIPAGKTGKYELERRIAGREATFLYGDVTASGGDNPDG
jgi:hypothetical protein